RSFRTEGSYRSKLEVAMHENEPIYRLVLGQQLAGEGDLERWVDRLYPLNARRHAQHERIEQTSMRLVANAGVTVPEVRHWINETFALTNLSGGARQEAADISKEKQTAFDPNPWCSFLPHIVAAAAEA